MPTEAYAHGGLCPIAPHVTEKGYRCVVTQTTPLSVLPISRIYCLPMPAVSVPLFRKTRIIYYSSEPSTNLSQS